MTAIPILQIRRAEGEDWCVAATWPDGHFEEIAGFKNETDANDWITKKFQAVEDREKKDSIALMRNGAFGAAHKPSQTIGTISAMNVVHAWTVLFRECLPAFRHPARCKIVVFVFENMLVASA